MMKEELQHKNGRICTSDWIQRWFFYFHFISYQSVKKNTWHNILIVFTITSFRKCFANNFVIKTREKWNDLCCKNVFLEGLLHFYLKKCIQRKHYYCSEENDLKNFSFLLALLLVVLMSNFSYFNRIIKAREIAFQFLSTNET